MDLASRLRERLPEIEQEVLARAYSVADPSEVKDPDYMIGLRTAVTAALDYGIAGIEAGKSDSLPLPPQLIAQARKAARCGVSLDTVLRRYFGGYLLLSDFIIQEAELEGILDPVELQGLLRSFSARFDELVTAIASEYTDEADVRWRSGRERRLDLVRRLLAGELADATNLGYELDAWHLGAIALGSGLTKAIREFAATLERSLLVLPSGNETVWIWLGGREELVPTEVVRKAEGIKWPVGARLTLGEPGEGIAGWRRTHRQASTAMSIAQHGSARVVRYIDVALLATVRQDELLASSLTDSYLQPLSRERDGGAALRRTLCAYFSAGHQVSSAAATLGVSRQTVRNRLRTIEKRIGRPLDSCALEMDAVLRLHDLADRKAS